MFFKDDELPLATDPVAPAQRSPAAQAKASRQHLPDGSPVHSWSTLLAALATLTRNRVRPRSAPADASFEVLATPTTLQARALALVDAAHVL